LKVAKTRHVFSNKTTHWVICGFIYLGFFTFFIWYHIVRGKPFSLWTTEKCTAIASVYCLGLALALGPLSRFIPSFDKLLPYRRTLGLTAAFMSIPHVILAIFYLPLKFPEKYSEKYFLSWFVSHWITVVLGFLVLVLFMIIVAYSYPSGIRKLGKRKWMILQKFSYLVMIMAVLHLLFMGKVPGWIEWFKTHDKPFPPGTFATTIFCLLVLLLKVLDLIFHGDSLALGTSREESSQQEISVSSSPY